MSVIPQSVDVGYLRENSQKVPVQMQIPGPHPRPSESESQGMESEECVFSQTVQGVPCTSEVENYFLKQLSTSEILSNLLDSQMV